MRRELITALVLKDLTETLRDRRTLVMMILLPILLYPMLIALFGMVLQSQADGMEERASRVVVLGDFPTRGIAHLKASGRIQLVNDPAGAISEEDFLDRARAQVPSHADAVVAAAPNLDDALTRGEAGKIRIYYDSVANGSAAAAKRVEQALDSYRLGLVAGREQALGVPAGFGRGLDVSLEDVAAGTRKSGQLLGSLLPLLLLMMSLMGAFYPAIDLTAGEKERGTMETLLCAPIRPLELILGKFVAVCMVSLLSTVANLLSIALTTWMLASRTEIAGNALQWQPEQLSLVLVLLAPTIIMMSALFLSVAVLARDFKDGQNLLTPLFTVIVVAGSAAIIPGMELGPGTAFVPVVNMVLLIQAVMVNSVDANLVLAVLASSAVWAALALALAARIFRQEQLLLGGGGSWRAVLGPGGARDGLPSTSSALLLFGLILPAVFYGSLALSGATSQSFSMLVIQIAGIVSPTVLMAALLRLRVGETFSLRLPPAGVLGAAVLMGPALWIINSGLTVRLMPPSESYEQAMSKAVTMMTGEASLPVMVLLMAALPALAEELAFRGIILRGLSRLGAPAAIGLSALLFGLAHADIYRLVPTILAGLVAGWLVWRSGSILPAILLHFLNNAVATTLAVLPLGDPSTWPGLLWAGEFPAWPLVIVALGVIALSIFWTWWVTRKELVDARQSRADRVHLLGSENAVVS